MTTKTKSWSVSTLNLYKQCAFKYKCVKIDKLPEKPSYALMKGIEAHSLAEQFLLGRIPNVPPVLKNFKKEMLNLKAKGAMAEEQFVLDDKWNLIPDGWKADNAWLRLKLDARIGNFIVDFKTGKHYDEHVDQARLYANVLLIIDSTIEEVDVEFWYLNSGEVHDYNFRRRELITDMVDWKAKVKVLHEDTEFLPTKNIYCKYCDFMSICPLYVGK